MADNNEYFQNEKMKNSPLGFIMPILISSLYCIALGAIQYFTGFSMYFFAFLSSYIIGTYMLKYLEYYTAFHKIIAAVYGLISYLIFIMSYMFFYYLQIGVGGALKIIFSFDGLRILISLTSGFNLIFLIITPISSYAYLEYQSKRRGF